MSNKKWETIQYEFNIDALRNILWKVYLKKICPDAALDIIEKIYYVKRKKDKIIDRGIK